MKLSQGFKELVNTPGKTLIFPHIKPDADALGSCLAWSRYLAKKGHQTLVISPTDFPAFLDWMVSPGEVINFQNEKDRMTAMDYINEADNLCCLDFSSLSRLDELGTLISESKASKVMIDHHPDPEDFAEHVFHVPQAAATAELIYELILLLDDKDMIDVPMGECIYAGIMTDTGSFRFSSTSRRIHEIIADLIGMGVNNSYIHQMVYDNNSLSRTRLLGHAISKKLVVLPPYNTAYIFLSLEEQKEFKSRTGDTEGFVNYALSLKGIRFASIMIESDDLVKMSFRSVGDFPANEFAKKHFGGGGHKNAAGGRSYESLEDTRNQFESFVELYKDALTN